MLYCRINATTIRQNFLSNVPFFLPPDSTDSTKALRFISDTFARFNVSYPFWVLSQYMYDLELPLPLAALAYSPKSSADVAAVVVVGIALFIGILAFTGSSLAIVFTLSLSLSYATIAYSLLGFCIQPVRDSTNLLYKKALGRTAIGSQ